MVTAAADVQGSGIWYEVLGWTRDAQSVVIDYGFFAGATDAPDAAAFEALRREVLDRSYIDAWGRPRHVDALGVDSGYRSHIVYSWVRANQRLHDETGLDKVFALKGVEGWGVPPVSQPSKVDINLAGRRIARGVNVWRVGTWPLKADVYSKLGRDRGEGASFPPGYCHFGDWLDDVYFRQLTAETLSETGGPRGPAQSGAGCGFARITTSSIAACITLRLPSTWG